MGTSHRFRRPTVQEDSRSSPYHPGNAGLRASVELGSITKLFKRDKGRMKHASRYEPQAFLSNQQPPFGPGWPLEVVTWRHRSISRVTLLVTECAREVAMPLPSDKSNPPRRGKTHGASTGLAVGPGFRFGTNAKCRPALKLSAYWGRPEDRSTVRTTRLTRNGCCARRKRVMPVLSRKLAPLTNR